MTDDHSEDRNDGPPPFSVQLASRVNRLPPYMFGRINKLLYDKRREGSDVIDLGMGNPSDPPEPDRDRKAGRGGARSAQPRLQRLERHPEPAARSGQQVLQTIWRAAGPRDGGDGLPGIERGIQPHVPGADGGGRHGHHPGTLFSRSHVCRGPGGRQRDCAWRWRTRKIPDQHRLHLSSISIRVPSC